MNACKEKENILLCRNYTISFRKPGSVIVCHLDMGINSIYIIRETPENRDHLESRLAGI